MSWFWPFKKTEASVPPRGNAGSAGFVDALNRLREPSAAELIRELKAMAWTCASINASVCASYPPKLYQRTGQGDIELFDHPILTLLAQVNPVMNAFDLWELTQLYLETTGVAYWLIEDGILNTPETIWPLPSQFVTPWRETNSVRLVDAYLYTAGGEQHHLTPEEVIVFRMPDLRDPYRGGMGPQRATYEQVKLSSEFAAFRISRFQNHAIPDALLSPDEVIGEEERDRLEALWNQRLRRSGSGRVIVADSKMHLNILQHSMGDLAMLADSKATREEIAIAFGVPQPYISGSTNLANLQAAEQQHGRLCIRPRIYRRDQKLNEQLVPRFDPTGQLYLMADDPVPEDRDFQMRRRNSAVQLGYMTFNEAREEIGLPPIEGGDRLRTPAEVKEPKPETGIEPQIDGDKDGEAGEAL